MSTKESKSTRALTGNRILSKPISNYNATKDEVAGLPGSLDWQVDGGVLYVEDYFDLSGYELDDLTLVPRSIRLLDGGPVLSEAAGFHVFDIVSQERLTDIGTTFTGYALGGLNYPSSKGSKDDWTQILFCNYRLFAPTTEFTFATLHTPATGGSFGSLEPTAVQKLWLYRVFVPLSLDPGMVVTIPATRFVISAEIIDEPDLEYMMRLKRSYELATQD